MRQTAQAKTQQDGRDASKDSATHAGQTIDAWIEAALAEQAKRAVPKTELDRPDAEGGARPKRAPRGRAAAETGGIETLMAASAASERRAAETASKTAVALGSVASWIERTQERLTETTAAASQAQERTAAVVNGAMGTLEQKLENIERKVETGDRPAVSQALKAIERIESRLGASSVADAAPTVIQDSLRGFEARIKDLSDRLSGPRPIGRRGIAPSDEIGQAVAEIRSHQAAIEAGTAGRRPAPASASVVPHAVAPFRGYGDMLSAMRADIARIAGKVDDQRAPALDGLKEEIDALRGSLADLPKREDLGAIERSVSALAEEVTTIRREGRTIGLGQMDALQAEIRRIGAAGGPADHAKLSRDLDVLSHKLDIVTASGMDPNATAAMAGQLDEIRAAFDGLASAREVASLGQQIADLKRNVAAIGKGQIDPAEFASLRGAVEEMRTSLARPAPGGPKAAGPVQLARGQLEPIEAMLAALADKIDRVQRHVSDPEALDQLERQLAALTTVLGSPGGRDPSLAALEHAMTALLREVVSWREGAGEIAERAARNALAETAQSRPSASDQVHHEDYVRHLAGLREDYAAVEKRVGRSLEGVEATLQGVVQRLGGLDRRDGAGTIRRDAAAEPHDPARRTAQPARRAAAPGEDDLPPAASAGEEVLLEPGERPRGRAQTATPTIDPGDIKSSFIAAARRAAQAAADDAAASKGGAAETDAGTASRTELLGRLRALFDRQRRPLLIGAAAIALALGGFQLTRGKSIDWPSVAGQPVAATQVATSVRVPTTRPAIPDPQTTQSLADGAVDDATQGRPDAATSQPAAAAPMGSQSASLPASLPVPAASQQAAAGAPRTDVLDTSKLAVMSAPAPSSGPGMPTAVPAAPAPARQDPAAAIAALRQAALGGNALALYDLGARTSDGRGVPRDLQLATSYFEKAAEKGLAPAQYRTGNAYEKGVGVARDLDAARTWYKRAADGGNTRAMHNLAVLIAEGAGGKPDYPAASGWFQRAAEQGVRDSQYNLAVLYARGLGTAQDFSKSYLWFAIAAGQGDEDAGRKRDEVGARLSAADLARAKTAVERWRPTPANVAANDVAPASLPAPANATADAPSKRQQREGRG